MSHVVEPVIRLRLRGVEFILDHAEARALIAELQNITGDRLPPAKCPPPATSALEFEDLPRRLAERRTAVARTPTRPLTEVQGDYFYIQQLHAGLRIPLSLCAELRAVLSKFASDPKYDMPMFVSTGAEHFLDVQRVKGTAFTFDGVALSCGGIDVFVSMVAELPAVLEHLDEVIKTNVIGRIEPAPADKVSVNCPLLEVVDGKLHLPTPQGLFICSPEQTSMIYKVLGYVCADPEKQHTDRSGGLVIAYHVRDDVPRVAITGGHTEVSEPTIYVAFELPEARQILDVLNKYLQAEVTNPIVPKYAAVKDKCLTLALDAEFKVGVYTFSPMITASLLDLAQTLMTTSPACDSYADGARIAYDQEKNELEIDHPSARFKITGLDAVKRLFNMLIDSTLFARSPSVALYDEPVPIVEKPEFNLDTLNISARGPGRIIFTSPQENNGRYEVSPEWLLEVQNLYGACLASDSGQSSGETTYGHVTCFQDRVIVELATKKLTITERTLETLLTYRLPA